MAQWSEEATLLRVAWLYYMDGLTQDVVAQRLGISRPSVARILERARRSGVVSVSLDAQWLSTFKLSVELARVYGLEEVLVVPDSGAPAQTQREANIRVGIAGALYLNDNLKPGATIGVGTGDTVSRVLARTDLSTVGPLHVVSLTGGVDSYVRVMSMSRGDAPASDQLTVRVIPSPIVASTATLAEALRREPTVQAVLEAARQVDFAVVGVGSVDKNSTLVNLGYLTATDAEVLAENGLVGDILGQFFSAGGEVPDLPIHERRIGLSLAELVQIGKVVGVAGGRDKVNALRGALRGGFLDVLITDQAAAQDLLA
jgi:lsr operon transcriptional repressor